MKIDRKYPPCWSYAKERLYRSAWAAVLRTNPRADRQALFVQALGYDKSHSEFTDLEFWKVLNLFRELAKPNDLFARLVEDDARKQQLLFSIRRSAQKLSIIACTAGDESIEQLEATRFALSRHVAARRRGELLNLEVAA